MGEMIKHFGDPHGLMNNEFKSRVCESSRINDQERLLLGSRFGLVTAWSSELTVSTLSNTHIIFSQVSVNHIPVMFGHGRFQALELEYGSSLSFLFGALPESRSLSLEYRIAGDKEWQRLENSQLTLDHLLPGHYRLLVRNYSQHPQNSMVNSLSFVVDNPWYWSSWAIVLYLCLSIGLIAFASWWCSRWVTKLNRKLKAQVALKTDQLRHQSKIVLTNNQQLRKQLQIRHIFVEQMLDSITPTLNQLIYRSQLNQLVRLESLAQKVKRELALLRNVRNDKTATQLLYDLSIILNSCVDGWREEFTKADISLAVNNELKQAYIESAHFNLDIIFNTLLSDAVKRLYRNQELKIHCYEREKRLFIVMIDCGDQVQCVNSDKRISGFELEEMQQLVQLSGGEIHIFSSSERNLVELSWSSVELISDVPEMIVVDDHSEGKLIEVAEKEWLKKVEQLVHQHYSDPEFSTSSAAKLLFVSERSLQRRFKAVTNKTFKEYLNELRLEKACQYLLAGGKVAQVAFDCGFNDPSYFSQRFKHHFGLSPTQFVDDNE
jgi:AraC family chitin signaling transcriptional activator